MNSEVLYLKILEIKVTIALHAANGNDVNNVLYEKSF